MSNEPKIEKQAPAPKSNVKTHLVVRTRTPRPFRRAGLTFTPEWSTVAIDDLSHERIKAIEAEDGGMLEVRRATEEEARAMTQEPGDKRTEHQLRHDLKLAEERATRAEARVSELESRIRAGHFAEPVARPKLGA